MSTQVRRFNKKYEIKNPLLLFNNSHVSLMNSQANLQFGHSIISGMASPSHQPKLKQNYSMVHFSRTINPGEAREILHSEIPQED